MSEKLIGLVCPKCHSKLLLESERLVCEICRINYEVKDGIPRFVASEGYTKSFGLQWGRFSKTQLDSFQKTDRSHQRFNRETQWSGSNLVGKVVVDAGCGAGRFAEVVTELGGDLIALDYSVAIEIAAENIGLQNGLFVQADLTTLPIADAHADYIYCIGVLQHTRAPKVIVEELLRVLKIGGELTLTFYENSSWHVKFYSKYLIRPVTKRIPKQLLLFVIEKTSFFWFPLTCILFSLPRPLNRIFRYIIPIANYVEYEYSSIAWARDEAILDTFDMLSPAYDRPIKRKQIYAWIKKANETTEILDSNVQKGTVRVRRVS